MSLQVRHGLRGQPLQNDEGELGSGEINHLMEHEGPQDYICSVRGGSRKATTWPWVPPLATSCITTSGSRTTKSPGHSATRKRFAGWPGRRTGEFWRVEATTTF